MAQPRKRSGFGLALRCFFRVLTDRGFADRVAEQLDGPAPPPLPSDAKAAAAPAKASAEPFRFLALLQREGRLIDFFMEDIEKLPDAQIGAAVRSIHRDCRKALQDHLTLEAVVDKEEKESITIPSGFDPAAVNLTGNLQGKPPFHGKVRHRGWRVKEAKLPPLPSNHQGFVVAPAEVEIP